MFNSLRTRLTLLFVILSIIPLAVVGILISTRSFAVLQAQTINFEEQLAGRTALSLGSFFSERQNELQVLTDVYGLGSLAPTSQRDVLLALLSEQPAYYALTLLDANGQETTRLTRGEIVTTNNLASRADDPLFQQTMASRAVNFSPVQFSEAARDRLITMAVPMENLFTGEISQVLVADLRFQNVQTEILRDLDLSADESVYIVDSSGVVIAHRNPNYVLRETNFAVPETSGRHAGLTGDDVILASDTIQLANTNLTAVAETPYANATAVAMDVRDLALAVMAGAVIISTLIIIFVVSRVVRPIISLSRAAQAIQAGDFSRRVQVRGSDEVGQLEVAFNEMSAAVQKREADLIEQADALRVATARAKEAARVKGEFLANVSHELRTPLNAIIGFSDMLLAGMSGELNEKQQHKMGRLKENGMRLLALINDLLDLTRIESGRLEMVEKEFSPRALAERISAQMESIAVESSLKFETVIEPDVPETLSGDEKRVEQVMTNLLSNAFKFTKEGSVVLNISANQEDHTWTLAVTDTGIGIPPHAINVIFEEFRQLDGSYTRAYKGSGLGLAITRNLVRMMGGKISVKSTLDVGSTFTVVLPMSIPVEAAKPVLVPAMAS